jgi:DNA repair exonuclease SbcCD ATPase subunit
MIAQATLPESEFGRAHLRDSLTALRLGHDGLEQFLGLLFDELDSLRDELDEEQARLDDERHQLREAQAQITAERNQWETDRQHWHDALQKRVVELEKDRLALAAELESERRRGAEMAEDFAEQRRQSADEQAALLGELRQLRISLDSRVGVGGHDSAIRERDGEADQAREKTSVQNAMDDAPRSKRARNSASEDDDAPPSRKKAVPTNPIQPDPVMGPLLSQFQLLQRDVARRREKKN